MAKSSGEEDKVICFYLLVIRLEMSQYFQTLKLIELVLGACKGTNINTKANGYKCTYSP